MDLTPNPNRPLIPDPVPGNKARAPLPSTRLRPLQQQAGFSCGLIQLAMPLSRSLSSKLEDVRVNGWLDAMIASSPGKNLDRNLHEEDQSDETDYAYISWTLKYPSALNSFEQITTYAEGKQIALFLDYDGTLTPIVEDPDRAIMSSAMRTAVRKAAKCFPTAIISGRCRDKVYDFIGLNELYYAGSHGMDIIGPVTDSAAFYDHPRSTHREGKEVNLFQPASDFIPMIDEIYKSLVENTKDIPGAKVENNKFCVSVHYRLVEAKNWPAIAQHVHDILKDYPRLRLTHGRKVLEVRPIIDWNKGKAVEFLLESLGLNDRENVLPIYIGDDRTDEDAFKVLRERNRGFSILVSSVPKESDAFYSLRDPSEVMDFLKFLVRWKEDETMLAN